MCAFRCGNPVAENSISLIVRWDHDIPASQLDVALEPLLSVAGDLSWARPPMEEADFGQSRFGHPDLTNFGQSQFWPIRFWPTFLVSWWGPEGWGPERWGPPQFFILFSGGV